MRVWVSIPNAPVHVSLNPRIRPGPEDGTPTFVMSRDGPIDLTPDAVWVLRLPYPF